MQNELVLAVINSIPEPIFVLNSSGVYLNVLGGSDRSRYHDGSGLIGRNLTEVVGPDLAAQFIEQIGVSIKTRETIIYTYSLASDEIPGNEEKEGPKGLQWFEAHISPVVEEDGSADKVIWIAFNITRLSNIIKKKEEQGKLFEQLAAMDPLTSLYNRRSYFQEGDAAFADFCSGSLSFLSVMMIDLDHFKKVNDTYGHEAGDSVLIMFAKQMKDLLREEDVIGRLGGEEFAALFRNKEIGTASEIADRVRERIESISIPFGDTVIRVTVSIGVSAAITGDTTIKDTLKRADEALYDAKRGGRNRVVVKENN